MKFNLLPIAAAGSVLFTSSVFAQSMTEVRISTSGADEEYVEIQGSASASTDGLMIVCVEGDPSGASGGVGTVDVVLDLSGNAFGADGFFVVGSTESAANLTFGAEIDLVPGSNLFENSSLTMYLLSVPDANDRTTVIGWDDTDISSPVGSTTTFLTQTAGITVLDAVALWDGDMGDVFFDAAPVFGPDGPFLPSGIFRPGGCPNDWCSDSFLNFGIDGVTDPGYGDPSPGSVNGTATCTPLASVGTCGGTVGSIGTAYCTVNPTSTGNPAVLTAAGSIFAADNDVTLTASDVPTFQFGFFLNSAMTGFLPNIGNNGSGNLCLGGSIARYNQPGQILNAGAAGEFSLVLDLTNHPLSTGFTTVSAGETWYFQAWFRDIVGGQASSNLTNGLEITFN